MKLYDIVLLVFLLKNRWRRWRMKKILSFLLAASMLLSLPVYGEEKPYMRELPQYDSYGLKVLSPESYPEVCISPHAVSEFFGDKTAPPVFLWFPGPEGTEVRSFSTDSAVYIDPDEKTQYTYKVVLSDSYEEFCNRAEKDEYIIMDGSDGTAAYIDPDNLSACGMAATREFGRSAKLR